MQIYLVGGAVRDMVLGISPHDRDYVVFGATPEEMVDLGYIQVGNRFPVFLHPQTHNEYALARKEEKIGKKHTDFHFIFTPNITPEEDVLRRDFTCNALLYDEHSQQLIDLVGGVEDIKKRLLRHINTEHFIEDPLRVLRMCRFAAKLNFSVAAETMELATKMVNDGMLDYLTPERVWHEIETALNEANFDIFITLMHKCGALSVVMPEVNRLWNIPFPTRSHQTSNVGEHTILVLKRGDNLCATAKFALLLHDIERITSSEHTQPHHHNHTEAVITIIQNICRRMRIPNNYRQLAITIAKQQKKFHLIAKMKQNQLLKLLQDVSGLKKRKILADYIRICRCAISGGKNGIPKTEMQNFRTCALRLILNFKIQNRLKAYDLPDFSGIKKDKSFADKLFAFRIRHII